ncbi:carbohydrate binding domain-containing protein [Bacteroides sp. OttesenSCG-928-F21]|nr:carbohydrate binding domain-containing protein [Bacteroides sp. OttesenSCG-928-F21]
MKRLSLLLLVAWMANSLYAKTLEVCNEPDSAFLFAYASEKNGGRNGLHFAWSIDMENWFAIGPEHAYLKCDYGRWGSQKRMLSPVLFQDKNGMWNCLWSLNEEDGAFAHAASADLVSWTRQSYPVMQAENNCLLLEAAYDTSASAFRISWISNRGGSEEIYTATTADFKSFTTTGKATELVRINQRDIVEVSDREETGTIHRVSWKLIDGLIKSQQLSAHRNRLFHEYAKDNHTRFAGLKPLEANISINAAQKKEISDLLVGVFFEDINYAADGGLYAELVQNRDFEYALSDKEGRDKNWNPTTAWTLKGSTATFAIDTVAPIHENNKHYAVLNIGKPGPVLTNEGFDGIVLTKGDKYDFSLFARLLAGKGGKITIRLVDEEGRVCGETSLRGLSTKWRKQEAVVTATRSMSGGRLEVIPQFTGAVALDMISLFPQKTFKGRKNGLRADLAQVIADIHPRFVRFPGGCVAHGDGIANIYRWENTIGALEARKPQRNLWGYHQTAGLGYFEYFQFCEDIGAEPLPVVAAGVPCQNSGCGGGGQQGGIPMCEMHNYVQDVLNLIEWANGDAKTTWGKKRAEAGHPKPFNLKYVGVGNEDLITDVFEERFAMIFNAVKEKYPEITVIGTVGPFSEGTDYVEGWELATRLNVPMVDEHYYQPTGWFVHNQDYYDRYDRNKSKVYLGEYACHVPGRHNNIETALAEALYMTSLERNGDVVSMTSYAPLLAKEGRTQWNPDLIYFNNSEVKPTVGYHVQKLYGQNAGDRYLSNRFELSNASEAVKKRFAVSAVEDSRTNDLIVKLVNFLPVPVKPTLSIEGADLSNVTVTKTILTGGIEDKNAVPVESSCSVDEMLQGELPAYSFVVYRIKGK